MKISFAKHSKTGKLILVYTCADGRLFYYTKQTEGAKGTSSIINRMKTAIETLEVHQARLSEPLTKQIVREALDKIVLKKSRETDIYSKMLDIIDKMEDGHILTPQNKRYSKGSLKAYRFTVSLLREFEVPNHVTLETYNKFIVWCQNPKQNFSTNYIGSQLKNWKRLGKLLKIPIYFEDGFKKIQEDAIDIYLDETEIKAIYDLKLTGKKELARDWFIIGCYTGLRVSDLTTLSPQSISGGYITIATEKTDTVVKIPVHPYVKAIIEKHKGLPKRLWDVEINEEIKKAAKEAGIKQSVLHTITKGGKRVDTYYKKYDMISCHTARRSLITNLRKKGVPDAVIMKLAGIKSPATLKKYDKLTADEAAQIAAGLDFFK